MRLIDADAAIEAFDKELRATEEHREYVIGFSGIEKVLNGLPTVGPEKNDQSAKEDNGKPKLSLVPLQILYDIAVVREYGCEKYPNGGKDNWKLVSADRYRDAMFRHMIAYIRDPASVDSESGLPHLWHLACNVAFLCEMERCIKDV